jgi:hypothetical protein
MSPGTLDKNSAFSAAGPKMSNTNLYLLTIPPMIVPDAHPTLTRGFPGLSVHILLIVSEISKAHATPLSQLCLSLDDEPSNRSSLSGSIQNIEECEGLGPRGVFSRFQFNASIPATYTTASPIVYL